MGMVRAILALPVVLVATAMAFLSATLFERLGSTTVRRVWLRHLTRLPERLARDGLLLARVLACRLRGEISCGSFRWVRFGDSGVGPEGAARRALARVALSFAPNTYVIDVDRERGQLLVHQLARPVAPGASWEELL